MRQQTAWTLALGLLVAASVAHAAPEEARQPPAGDAASPDPGGRHFARPESQPPTLPSGPVAARPAPAATPKSTTPHGPYQSLRALQTKEGEALVQTAEGRRVLRPGDRLGTDIVKVVDEGLLVLDRPATPGQPGGDRRIVVRFDAQGRASVRIYSTEDPTAVELPKVH